MITALQQQHLGAEGGHGPWERLRATRAPAEPWMVASRPRRLGNLLLQTGCIPLPLGTRCPWMEEHPNAMVPRRPGLPAKELVYPITGKDRLEKGGTALQGQGRHGRSQHSSAWGVHQKYRDGPLCKPNSSRLLQLLSSEGKATGMVEPPTCPACLLPRGFTD